MYQYIALSLPELGGNNDTVSNLPRPVRTCCPLKTSVVHDVSSAAAHSPRIEIFAGKRETNGTSKEGARLEVDHVVQQNERDVGGGKRCLLEPIYISRATSDPCLNASWQSVHHTSPVHNSIVALPPTLYALTFSCCTYASREAGMSTSTPDTSAVPIELRLRALEAAVLGVPRSQLTPLDQRVARASKPKLARSRSKSKRKGGEADEDEAAAPQPLARRVSALAEALEAVVDQSPVLKQFYDNCEW